MTKRQLAYQQRESNVQRRVLLGIVGAVLLALLIVAAGAIYDQVVVPGRTVKAVNGETLSRGDYEQIARNATIQQIAQSAFFSSLLGPNASFGENQGGTFNQQVVQANQQLSQLGTIRGRQQPVADETVTQWVDARLIEQGAQNQFQINPSQGEVDQVIVARLGNLLAEPESPTSTTTLTPTAGLTGTASVTETVAPEATSAATPTAVPSPTTGPTTTPSPTVPPTPSPEAAVATEKAEQIIDKIYDEYTAVLRDLPPEAIADVRNPHASREDFATALRAQYRDELIRTRVQELLITEVNPEDTAEPAQINARHILLKVPEPEATPTATAGPDATAAAETTATAGADTTATTEATPTMMPSPTATLAPEALEELFADRKAEIDAIYERVTQNPDSFAEIATEESEDEASAARGGELGAFGRGQMTPPFEEAAFALGENEISEPIRTEFGWHIIQRMPEDPTAKLERQRQAAFDEWLQSLRSNATIVPAPTASPTEAPIPTEAATETVPEPGAGETAPEAGATETTGTEPAATTGAATAEPAEPEATAEATTSP